MIQFRSIRGLWFGWHRVSRGRTRQRLATMTMLLGKPTLSERWWRAILPSMPGSMATRPPSRRAPGVGSRRPTARLRARCHTGWNFTDNRFPEVGASSIDIGRGALEPDNGVAFRPFSLRDRARRAPYRHEGSFARLNDVRAEDLKGEIDRPSGFKLPKPINLNNQKVADAIELQKSLTGSKQVVVLPVLPN